jgi:hypothetical protein
MPGRRTTTTTKPTPIEETEPTAPAPQPASPVEPEPQDTPEPTAEELDDRLTAETEEERIGRMVDEAVARLRPASVTNLLGWQLGSVKSAAAEEGDYPLTVHEAVAEVTRLVGHIAKDRQTEGGERYKFRGIDDVLSALHPILGEVGLVILPGRMVEHRRETRATARGGTLNVALVLVRYTLVGPDGTKLRGEAWGEAGDSGDKATQKALSQAYKTFALQTFSIPTEASAADDPDLTNEPGRAFTGEEQQRALTAWQAALNTTTLDALVGVRRRAEHLLTVPVDAHGDGTVAPLSYWLDRRRAELEGVTG